MNQIEEALLVLDPDDDSHWTEDGLPVVQVVSDLVGKPDLTREEVTSVSPQFGRQKSRELRDLQNKDVDALPESTEPEAELASKIRDEDEKIAELSEKQQEIDQELKIAYRERSRLVSLQLSHRGEQSNQQAIRAAIESSNRRRAERVAVHREMMKTLSPQQLDPRTPLEQAHSKS